MIQLRELCDGVGRLEHPEDGDVRVTRVDHDSRSVQKNGFFMALPGRQTNGLKYVQQALDNGAVAIGVEEGSERPTIEPPVVWFPKARPAMAILAKRVVNAPNEELELIAVTGTNGKTSVTTILHHILTQSSRMAGLIGTIETKIGTRRLPTNFTTPESTDFYRVLRAMRDEDVRFVCAEFSSIGMEEHRVDGTAPRLGAYLNLSQDHLDYHKTMTAYGDAKSNLFIRHLAPGGTAFISIDDNFGRSLFARVTAERPDLTIWGLSTKDQSADVYGALSCEASGIRGEVRLPTMTVSIETPLLGEFNVQNVTMSVALAAALGLQAQEIERSITQVRIPGRLELVGRDDGVRAVVDYAHTPDALSAALSALRPLTEARLICVFGCGGDRDRGKRAQMAVAASAADVVFVTSDNPRTEDPDAIISDVVAGFESTSEVYVDRDRRAAIHQALAFAKATDIVLIAGKGHETYQEIGGQRHPFSDVETVAAWRNGGAS